MLDLLVPIERNNTMFFKSIAIWLILMMIESLNGTIRTLWLVPLLGDLRAHQISLAIGSLLILTIATLFVRWLKIANVFQSLA
jgi:phosphoglycerol transferase MdoB-like AlkP superfamily enzyme